MLGNKRVQYALALVTMVAMGCSDGGNTDGSGGRDASSGGQGGMASSSSTGGDGGGGTMMPPMCSADESTVLAASELFFGEGNSGEWKKVGWNLDNLESTATSKDVCKPAAGASPSTPYPDGDGGIDNSFGKNLLPVILSLYPTWVDDIYKSIQNGFFTSMLKIECLPETGDAPLLNTKLFGATPLPNKPVWDGTDTWSVAPELLSDPTDPDSSTIIFSQSSVTGSTFDAGKNGTFVLSVPLKTMTDSTSIKLTLYAAKLQMTLADDRKSSSGMLGGVLNTEEFVAEVKKVGYLLNLCDTSVLDNVITQVRQASDILTDGTQDPERECDGISMGMGFDMKKVLLGDVGPAAPVGMSCK